MNTKAANLKDTGACVFNPSARPFVAIRGFKAPAVWRKRGWRLWRAA